MRQRLVALVAAVLVLGGGVFLLTRGGSAPAPPAVTTSADPSAWSLPRLGGSGVVRLADFRGRPLVVNFFASWCDPCRDELPLFASVSHDLDGRVGFAGVNSEETGDGLAMARQYGVGGWPLASDIGGANLSGLHDALGGQGMPLTAFYDANGRLLKVHLGAFSSAADLRAAIQQYAGAAG